MRIADRFSGPALRLLALQSVGQSVGRELLGHLFASGPFGVGPILKTAEALCIEEKNTNKIAFWKSLKLGCITTIVLFSFQH